MAVGRFIHNIALRRLFRVVRLEFGLWESIKPVYNDLDLSLDEVGRASAARTATLMNRIAHDAHFAEVVRHLRIHSFSQQDDILNSSTPPVYYLSLTNAS